MASVSRQLPRAASLKLPLNRTSIVSTVARGSFHSLVAPIRPFCLPISQTANFTNTVTRKMATAAQPPAKAYDHEIVDMAAYIHNNEKPSDIAWDTAHYAVVDALGCGLAALKFPECTKLLGPIIPGTVVPNGVKVPGTPYVLDPLYAAFNIGAMNRWLDYNDAWVSNEWGHPSDNLAAILSVADWISRTNRAGGNLVDGKILKIKDVKEALIKAYEIQGVLALGNSFNKVGLDHVVLLKVSATAAVSKLLGLDEAQTRAAISHAWCDGQSLRTYRHTPNTMSRKSWAAGDAVQTAINLALKVKAGEIGMPTVLSQPGWGFYDVNFGGQKLKSVMPYGSYVMESVLFKVAYPAEFHAQTAVEAAEKIHHQLKAMGKTGADIESVTNRTHEACIRIIDKQHKSMDNFADRDHCVQYMATVMLVFGRLEASDYTDGSEAATSEDVARIHKNFECVEDPQLTQDYHDLAKRTITNGLTVRLKDGTVLDEVLVEVPLGHKLRRDEAKPEILAKYKTHVEPHFEPARAAELIALSQDAAKLENMDVDKYMDLYHKP